MMLRFTWSVVRRESREEPSVLVRAATRKMHGESCLQTREFLGLFAQMERKENRTVRGNDEATSKEMIT